MVLGDRPNVSQRNRRSRLATMLTPRRVITPCCQPSVILPNNVLPTLAKVTPPHNRTSSLDGTRALRTAVSICPCPPRAAKSPPKCTSEALGL